MQPHILPALPKSAHRAAMRGVYKAEDIDKVQSATMMFEVDYGVEYPKAVAEIAYDAEMLLEFCPYPTFATARLRPKVITGWTHVRSSWPLPTSSSMPYKPAGANSAPQLVALARAGTTIHIGEIFLHRH
jgi:putative transposase